MAQKLPSITLRYNGIFDFDGLYAAIIDWAKNYGYMWHEKTYKHKVPSPTGAEQELEWVMEKNVTEYIKYTINFTVHIWDMKPAVVEFNGKNKELTQARLYIKMDGTITPDWQKKFENSGRIMKYLGSKFESLTGQIGQIYWDQLYYRMWNLHSIMKKYFDMQAKKHEYKGYLGEN